jgi:hypothetical protein
MPLDDPFAGTNINGGTFANGISDNVIVGSYYDGNGVSHGFSASVTNYTLSVNTSPNGGGIASGGGIFLSGSSQVVIATAYSGFTFANWTQNGNVVSASASYNLTLNSNVNLVANFSGVGLGGTSFLTLGDPLASTSFGVGTFALGISGGNIVGSYEMGYNHGFRSNGTNYFTLDVPNPNYYWTIATGISADNIVGWYTDGTEAHGFLYANGNYTTLDNPKAYVSGYPTYMPDVGYGPLLSDSQFDAWGGTFPTGICGTNIVGWYFDTNSFTHGFLYNGRTYTTLDDPLGLGSTYALGIDGGNIVGFYTDTNNSSHGFLYNGSTYATLDDPNGVGSTFAQGISGTNIVGCYVDKTGGNHGFIYNSKTYTTLDFPGSLGGGSTYAQGISSNTVVGWYIDSFNKIYGFAYNLGEGSVDAGRPTINITAPTSGQLMTNALATVVGTASDNSGVANVWYQLNNAAWNAPATANGWTNWTTTVELISGTNTVKAYAKNLGGNFSTTNSVSFVSSNTFKLQLTLTNSVPLKTNGLVFSLQLSTGLNGHIQVSSNLTSWTTLTNFVGTNSTVTFRDAAATNSPRRFYRAVVP